ncbi:putative hydroxypyruvate isomerase [Agrilus planipennis]|uniref:Putative hydroxypyruvate isomerase n=1 Tax=Agrilus planipennis TaxID=224129 RepID=A0A1W4XH11_AGRPL|nr:putative hydroxypyruvate isomerase [Agrilus planipennis]
MYSRYLNLSSLISRSKSLFTKVTMAKFCPNLSFLFTEKPFLERYGLAKQAGFKVVESGFPLGFSIEQVSEARSAAGIQQVLLNIFTGDTSKGELGFAAIPGKEKEFRDSLDLTINYAKALGATKIHVMSGKIDGEVTSRHDETFESNIRYAADILEKNNIVGLLEPINKYSVPNYYMNSFPKAISLIEKINKPSIRLQFDIFHIQQIQGDIKHTLDSVKKYIGHVQIAQVPDRNEPDTLGEVNFHYIFKILQDAGYNDWIGLEYKPAKETVQGLKWIKEYGYQL